MLTSIVSLDQGKQRKLSEQEFYELVPEWRAPSGLGRFLGWLRPANARDSGGAERQQALTAN